jgi:hypothetical protein
MTHKTKTIHGVDKRIIFRRDVNNKSLWVFTVFWADMVGKEKTWRMYPNIISSRYLSRRSAEKGADKYLATGKLDYSDEGRKK